MGDILLGHNERKLVLIPRSGSHSFAATWMKQEEPENFVRWESEGKKCHPAAYLRHQENSQLRPSGQLAVIVRNPVERFRSMIAHRELDIEHQIKSPMYSPLPSLTYTTFFRYEDQLQQCASWLGINIELFHIYQTHPSKKPTLTTEQEIRVRQIYHNDIILWESLQSVL